MLCTRSLNYSIIITHFVWETLLATFPFPTYLTIPPCPYYLSIVVVVAAPGTACHMAPFQQFICLPTTSYVPSWRCLAVDSKHPIMSSGWRMSLEMSLSSCHKGNFTTLLCMWTKVNSSKTQVLCKSQHIPLSPYTFWFEDSFIFQGESSLLFSHLIRQKVKFF
jgi:hypothetical protein